MTDTKPQKPYYNTEQGGVAFRSERKPGEVRIPNYVFDLWMPLLGSDVIGVYATYCRLEMAGSVKKMHRKALAAACCIGTDKLDKIDEKLKTCGFIRIIKPEGMNRLKHFTTEIVVLDPPASVSPELIAQYATKKDGYQPLTPWLVGEQEAKTDPPENPNGYSGDPEWVCAEWSNGDATIAFLGLLHLFGIAAVAPQPPKAEPIEEAAATLPIPSEQERDTALVFQTYENNFGTYRQAVSDEIKDALDEFSADWIVDAIKEAALSGGKSWKYVRSILERWSRDGKEAKKPGDTPPPPKGVWAQNIPITPVGPAPLTDAEREERRKLVEANRRKKVTTDEPV